MSTKYVPDRGDVVSLSLDPQAGHEQKGRRPVLVVSPAAYNLKTSLAIFCPITSQSKGYPFEVPIPKGHRVKGVILSDQVKSLDWRIRRARFVCRLPRPVLVETIQKIGALLGIEIS